MMKNMNNHTEKLYFKSICYLVVLISILNALSFRFHLLWKFWWFDMVLHTLGGVFVGSFALWYHFFRKTPLAGESSGPKTSSALLVSLVAVAVIGIGWELFEFSVDKFISFSRHDPVDTASDLFFDALGGIFAVSIFFLVYNKNAKIKR